MSAPTGDLPPTRKQLAYLRQLATQRGQTFATPTTRRDASAQIDRLKRQPLSTAHRVTDRLERRQVSRELAERPSDATRVRDDETTGYGSSATWR